MDFSSLGKGEQNPQFLFIVGPPRSTNTAILGTLDGHPDILAWPTEFHYFTFYRKFARGRNKIQSSELNQAMLQLFDKYLNIKLGRDTEDFPSINSIGAFDYKIFLDQLDQGQRLEHDVLSYLRHIFDCLKAAHTQYKDKAVKYYALLCTARGIDWTNGRLFGSSRFLFPYRCILESYSSIRERRLKSQSLDDFFAPTAKMGALYWLNTFERISQKASQRVNQENFLVVSAERLRYESEVVISELCEFLAVDYDSAMSQMTVLGQRYLGNANELTLNQGRFANRSSALTIPLSSFETTVLAQLDLFDFASTKKCRIAPANLAQVVKSAFNTAFLELNDNRKSMREEPGNCRFAAGRLKLFLKLCGIYLILRGGLLSRLILKGGPSYTHLDHLN